MELQVKITCLRAHIYNKSLNYKSLCISIGLVCEMVAVIRRCLDRNQWRRHHDHRAVAARDQCGVGVGRGCAGGNHAQPS